MRRRVVITGVGCVTPLGADSEVVWGRLTEGVSGVGRISLFDASNFPVRIAAEVRDWDLSQVGEDPNRWRYSPRQTHFALGAGLMAYDTSGIRNAALDPVRLGVYLGCGECFPDFGQMAELMSGAMEDDEYHPEKFMAGALRIWRPQAELEMEPNMPASHLAAMCDAQGPNANCIAACASSTQAIGQSMEIIRRGDADVMLAGGAHSMIHPLGMSGFQRLSALSHRNEDPQGAVRPFDRDRDGFVVGEGGAVFVLEELSHAQARGAEIWGELTGFGSAQDAYRVTDSHPEGRGAATSIQSALADARLDGDQIDYINAHGTGTVVNDRVETQALKEAFGLQAYRIPISSTKSMMGHFTTAGGAIELAVCLMALRYGVVPPTINLETPDPDCDLDYVPHTAREIGCRHILSNSFGFGGQNAALVVSQFQEASRAKVARRAA
jgi:3-oxoacyl-[acyl-carrier-protein] synthase II